MSNTLEELTEILEQRKSADPEQSYVASLHHEGLNKIPEKVGEEATEVIIAAKDAQLSGNRSDLVAETADLWFHCMVMLSHCGGSAEEVTSVLRGTFQLVRADRKSSSHRTTLT
jgi:phosphoribosyl-ATP pyrophosphohydrolase